MQDYDDKSTYFDVVLSNEQVDNGIGQYLQLSAKDEAYLKNLPPMLDSTIVNLIKNAMYDKNLIYLKHVLSKNQAEMIVDYRSALVSIFVALEGWMKQLLIMGKVVPENQPIMSYWMYFKLDSKSKRFCLKQPKVKPDIKAALERIYNVFNQYRNPCAHFGDFLDNCNTTIFYCDLHEVDQIFYEILDNIRL